MKTLWFDVETTGRNPEKHDIIQLAMIVDIDGEIVEEHNLKMQPTNYDTVEQEALDVHGITVEEMKSFPPHDEVYARVMEIFSQHINKFDKQDKFYPGGFNVGFDLDFLLEFFVKHSKFWDKWNRENGIPPLGSYIKWVRKDPLPILHQLEVAGMLSLPNYKLETAANAFGIEIDAHDALSDVRATRELYELLDDYVVYSKPDLNQTESL